MTGRDRRDPAPTIGGRVMAALASLPFSVPLAALFWFLLNIWLAGTDAYVPAWACVAFVLLLAALSSVRPGLATDVLEALMDFFFRLGRYW